MPCCSCFGSSKKDDSVAQSDEKIKPVKKRSTKDSDGIAKFSGSKVEGSHRCEQCQKLVQRLGYWHGQDKAERKPWTLHANFAALQESSIPCQSCRVFRRAILLRQPSAQDEKSLLSNNSQAVTVILQDGSEKTVDDIDGKLLFISVGGSREYTKSAYVAYTHKLEDHPQLPQYTNKVHEEARKWFVSCRDNHQLCSNLALSADLPTRLIEIKDERNIKLIETKKNPDIKEYVALSYCWGPYDERVARGNTREHNFQKRLEMIPIDEMPQTLRDAVAFTYRLGIKYIWIDSVCIIQIDNDGADFQLEAPKMASVYGNASLTLTVGSNHSATEHMLNDNLGRSAWRNPGGNVRFGRHRIVNFETTLDEARDFSPHAERAWTLQEEFLSPRRLYCFNHALYWACAEEQFSEGDSKDRNRPVKPPHEIVKTAKCPQDFLKAGHEGNRTLMHNEWLGIVESYARRQMKKTTDRFTAIAGCALRRYQSGGAEEYLAGIWRSTYAQDLSWSLDKAENLEKNVRDRAPSWSWASVPLETRLTFERKFEQLAEEEIELSEACGVDGTKVDQEAPNQSTEEKVQQGALIKSIHIKGRLRKLWKGDCVAAPWAEVHDEQDRFFFNDYRGQPVKTVNPETGVLEVAEKGMKPIRGQLDYKQFANLVEKGRLLIFAFRIGRQVMLLLEMVSPTEYKRVGISYTFNAHFFDDAELATIWLV